MKILKRMKKTKLQTTDEQSMVLKPRKVRKISKRNVLTLVCAAVLVFAHVAVLWAIASSWRYYAIYPSLFGSIVAIIVCALAIIDIIFFVGFNHKDLFLKIVSTVLAVLLMVGGTVGSYYISKTNAIVGNVLDNGKGDKYELFSGVFVCYDKYNKFTGVNDLAGKKVGMLIETSNGIRYIAENILKDAKIDYATVDYKTNAEMMQGLLDGDVDAIVITSAYRNMYKGVEETPGEEGSGEVEEVEETETEEVEEVSEEETGTAETAPESTTEESPFTRYLPNLIDFYPFEQELKTNTSRSTKNISAEPFNVLLIGYSRTDIGSTVGLADSIILTTINPQTYTVSMTSIARDSFVPIACYGGEYDKINSGRSTSRSCFIETVENFVGMDIDYYMELDYLGLVQIVNVIGGIYINNPVSFTLDGIYVPAGEHVFADGQMALQFARERHHMPGGDFDRQQHQKEVIIEIAKAFIESGDITLALRAMEEASEWMSTDFTLSQLTGIFNLLLNTKNYTGLKTFDLVDFQNSRMTGYGGIMYYSYDMRLPLWVYLVYKGSYDESIEHINNVMGNYDTITQDRNFTFNFDEVYARPAIYSTEYPQEFMYTPDPMPPYWADLTGMSVSSAQSWASSNGVSLSIKYISPGDSDYDASYENMIVSQNPRYGTLISDVSSGSVVAMAPNVLDENKQVPDFVGKSYTKAKQWAKEHGISCVVEWVETDNSKAGTVKSQSPSPYTSIDSVSTLTVYVYDGEQRIKFDTNGHGKDVDPIVVKISSDSVKKFPDLETVTESDGFRYKFAGWYTSNSSDAERVYDSSDVQGSATVYARWTKECAEHVWGDWVTIEEATCEHGSIQESKCKNCDETQSRELEDKKEHSWGEWVTVEDPTCEHGTIQRRTCTKCNKATEEKELDDKLTGEGCSSGGGEGGTGNEGDGGDTAP